MNTKVKTIQNIQLLALCLQASYIHVCWGLYCTVLYCTYCTLPVCALLSSFSRAFPDRVTSSWRWSTSLRPLSSLFASVGSPMSRSSPPAGMDVHTPMTCPHWLCGVDPVVCVYLMCAYMYAHICIYFLVCLYTSYCE